MAAGELSSRPPDRCSRPTTCKRVRPTAGPVGCMRFQVFGLHGHVRSMLSPPGIGLGNFRPSTEERMHPLDSAAAIPRSHLFGIVSLLSWVHAFGGGWFTNWATPIIVTRVILSTPYKVRLARSRRQGLRPLILLLGRHTTEVRCRVVPASPRLVPSWPQRLRWLALAEGSLRLPSPEC